MKVYFEKGLTVINTGDPVGGQKNKTGHCGIRFRKPENSYQSYICIKKDRYHLGHYENLEDAVAIRKEAEKHRADGTFHEWFQTLYGTSKQIRKCKGSKYK